MFSVLDLIKTRPSLLPQTGLPLFYKYDNMKIDIKHCYDTK